MTRQQFIRNAVLATAGLSMLGCGQDAPASESSTTTGEKPESVPTTALPYFDTIGLQLWSVRDLLETDPETTLKTLAEMGYKQVELMSTGQAAKLVPLAKSFGLAVNSSFINWNTVTGNWRFTPDETPFEFDEVIKRAEKHGLSHLIFGYLRPEERTSADDWKRVADQVNEAAEQAHNAGLQMAYHNHNFEWDPVDGTTGWEILSSRLEPELVPFELDVFWAAHAGQDPLEVMESIQDRLELLHLKQLNPATPTATRTEDTPPDAFEELPDGELPIVQYMRVGKEMGVKYCFVEQDGNYDGTSLNSVRRSVEFLREQSATN